MTSDRYFYRRMNNGPASCATYERITAYADAQGLELYLHEEEAILELLANSNNVVLATPTGSGKSLVATAEHMAKSESRPSVETRRPGSGLPQRR